MAAIDKVKIIVVGDSGKDMYMKQFYNIFLLLSVSVILFIYLLLNVISLITT